MAVCVESQRDRRVAEAFCDDLRVLAGEQQQGRARVTQAVELEVLAEPALVQDRVKVPPREVGDRLRAADDVREYEVVIEPCALHF